MNTQYVLIKNNLVVQTVFLDNPTDEILDNLKLEYDADTVEISDHPNAETGSSWDGAIFVKPKPYPSWVLDEFNQWVAPFPYPTPEQNTQESLQIINIWNENTKTWDEIAPYPSWVLAEFNQWVAPVPRPSESPFYTWNESNQTWDEIAPYPSWVLDEFNQWVAPVPRPVYKIVEEVPVYEWNETIVNWVEKSS